MRGKLALVIYLLKKVNKDKLDTLKLLDSAIESDRYDILKHLIEEEELKPNNVQLLHTAIQKDNIEIVKYLINKNLDINAIDKEGNSSVAKAILDGGVDCLRYFILEQNVNINSLRIGGKTPLEYALTLPNDHPTKINATYPNYLRLIIVATLQNYISELKKGNIKDESIGGKFKSAATSISAAFFTEDKQPFSQFRQIKAAEALIAVIEGKKDPSTLEEYSMELNHGAGLSSIYESIGTHIPMLHSDARLFLWEVPVEKNAQQSANLKLG